ncbi:MAG: TnpV protein [Lachnospiraceae bacterium]|nr:TnpV protein [Lachnospiraceae bacterium]
MYYPALKYDTTEPHYGKYGLLRKQFLQEHHKGYYNALLLRGKLTEHLNQIDDAANIRIDFLVSQMQQQRHIDETLKVHDQITWIREMNNIYKAAEEIILNELIHS